MNAMETCRLILVRGPSGSGKTTIARSIERTRIMSATRNPQVVVHEADQFFVNESGAEYNFDPTKLRQAHHWCQTGVEKHIVEGVPVIVISNTSMTKWELDPYLRLAERYTCELEIWRTPGPWDAEVLFARNVHGVPLATIKKQIGKYQPLDDEKEWNNNE